MVDKDEKFYIGTTRFTNSTYSENMEWRQKHNWKGCIYGVNKKMPRTVPYMALVFVVEMNNDTNKIEGVGLVRNYINSNYKTCVYKSDRNYNRYIYNSAYRKDISEITNKKVIEILELLLFYGARHYKRGQGITTINWNRLSDKAKLVLKHFFHSLF
jgi:hypothetical protein